MQPSPVIQSLRKYANGFHPVVPFSPDKDKLLPLNFTDSNAALQKNIYGEINAFSAYISRQLAGSGCRYGIGGYDELRSIYSIHPHFGAGAEPRRLHLGVDIWGAAGTPIYGFMGGSVHSFAFNDRPGDYGATLVLLHQLDGFAFYTLYGHISLKDIEDLTPARYIVRGQEIAHFGEPHENGGWPPHLHFQVILDMELKQGDYPGVCKFSERNKYLQNCPDPELILQMNQYAETSPHATVM